MAKTLNDLLTETKEGKTASPSVPATIEKSSDDVISPERISCSPIDEEEPKAKPAEKDSNSLTNECATSSLKSTDALDYDQIHQMIANWNAESKKSVEESAITSNSIPT